jgi:hypothetical protein
MQTEGSAQGFRRKFRENPKSEIRNPKFVDGGGFAVPWQIC